MERKPKGVSQAATRTYRSAGFQARAAFFVRARRCAQAATEKGRPTNGMRPTKLHVKHRSEELRIPILTSGGGPESGGFVVIAFG